MTPNKSLEWLFKYFSPVMLFSASCFFLGNLYHNIYWNALPFATAVSTPSLPFADIVAKGFQLSLIVVFTQASFMYLLAIPLTLIAFFWLLTIFYPKKVENTLFSKLISPITIVSCLYFFVILPFHHVATIARDMAEIHIYKKDPVTVFFKDEKESAFPKELELFRKVGKQYLFFSPEPLVIDEGQIKAIHYRKTGISSKKQSPSSAPD